MSPRERCERWERARSEAAARMLEFTFAEASAEDVMDAIEIALLWRLVIEGRVVSPMTEARMIEATDVR